MKVKLKTEKTFSFDIGGQHFDGYREESTWEGFAKYAKGQSWLVLHTAGHGLGGLDIFFGEQREYPIVTASPDVVTAIERAERVASAEGSQETVN